MTEIENEGLWAVAARQAEARARGDDASFASYMTPKALLELGSAALPPGRVRKSRVLSVEDDDGRGQSDVEYQGSWRYVIRTNWTNTDGHWKATDAALLSDSVCAAWWRRILRRTNYRPEPAAPRVDLS